MKVLLVVIGLVFLNLGCARVQVEAPKEPIKVDISMRLDIYQHVVSDIDKIESLVSGESGRASDIKDQGSSIFHIVKNAYAEDLLSGEVQDAALRRKGRHNDVIMWEGEGVIGENRLGFLQIRDASKGSSYLENLVKEENKDRMIIYQALAEKNGVHVREIQSIYAQKLQEGAPSDTPIEVYSKSTGAYEWIIK